MSLYFRTLLIVLVLITSFLCQGCVKDRAEMEKEILGHDPSFQKDLDKRNTVQKEIASLEAAYRQTCMKIDEEITALKEKKTQVKNEYLTSLDKLKRQVNPEVRELQRNLLDMQRDHKRQKEELGDIDRDIKEINSLINKKDQLVLTQEEVKTWNERLASLAEKKSAADSEIERLAKEIEITKLKIKVLSIK